MGYHLLDLQPPIAYEALALNHQPPHIVPPGVVAIDIEATIEKMVGVVTHAFIRHAIYQVLPCHPGELYDNIDNVGTGSVDGYIHISHHVSTAFTGSSFDASTTQSAPSSSAFSRRIR